MKFIRSRATLTRYVLSNIAVVILSCALLWGAFFITSVRELTATAENEQRQKLAMAAEYMHSQIEIMRNVSFRIQLSHLYKPSQFSKNKYDEVLLLEDFRSYENYTPLTSDYFLYYKGKKTIFKTSATNDFNYYLRDVHHINDITEITERLDALGVFTVVSSEQNERVVFFAFPVRIQGRAGGPEAVLCFAVNRADIVGVTERVVGRFPNAVTMRWNGVDLSPSAECNAQDTGARLSASFEGVECFLNASLVVYGRLNDFMYLSLFVLGGVAVILLGLAILVSYRNYDPIRKLVQRSASLFKTDGIRANEIDMLNELLNTAYEKTESVSRQINESLVKIEKQASIIRAQIAECILNGRTVTEIDGWLNYLGVFFAGPVFGAALVQLDPYAGDTACEMNKITELSDGTVKFFASRFRDGSGFAILIIMDSPDRFEEALELINAVLESSGCEKRVAAGYVTEDVSEVPKSFTAAIYAANLDRQTDGVQETGYFMRYNEIMLPQISAHIQNADSEQALALFSQLAGQLNRHGTSISERRAVYADVLDLVLLIADKNRLDVDRDRIGEILLSEDMDELPLKTAALIEGICSLCRAKIAADEKRVSGKLIQYIEEHANEYDMSLARLSREYSISEKQISRILKDMTGRSYKDYLAAVRVAHACSMLTDENLSVSETSERVGFANVSHFIRMFKTLIGVTPAIYKKV